MNQGNQSKQAREEKKDLDHGLDRGTVSGLGHGAVAETMDCGTVADPNHGAEAGLDP